MSNFAEIINEKIPTLKIAENELLSEHSSFHIGGKADFFAEPENEKELISLVKNAKEAKMNFCVIGNASNILFGDGGFRGVVISMQQMKNITVCGENITADCGVSLTALSNAAQKASLDGVRFLCGIPGTVGGGVYMNAGAYGGEVSCVLASSRFYDSETDVISDIQKSEHEFAYRHSSYMEHPERILLSATFALHTGNPDEIRAEMDNLLARRREKQPLEYPSAGSTFKRYPGFFTANLIDECGLKGYSVGGAQVSEKHAGFVINRGGATAKDVLEVVNHIKKTVFEKKSINIECEIRIIGEM